MKIIIAALGCAILSTQEVNALNVEVDIKTSTKHHECTVYAEGVKEFAKLYIESSNQAERAWLIEQVDYMKKQLKKCEKNNKKVRHDVGIKVGGTFKLSEK